ncbi:oligosaccharide flippase family protein [Roseivirga echinicomitans]
MKSVSFANFFHLSLNQGVNVLVGLVVTRLLFQTLGEGQYGLVDLGLSVVMLLSVLVNYGFHLNGPKRLALTLGNSVEQSRIINEIVITKLLISVLLSIGVLVAVFVFGFFSNYSYILTFSLVILFSEALFPMFILQGLDRLSLISKANAIAKLFYLAAIVLVIKSSEDAQWVNFLFGTASLLVNLSLLVLVYKKWNLSFQWPSLIAVFVRLKENFQFFISTIAGHVSVHGGLLILSNFVTDIELGRYALAQRIAFLLRMIPVFLTQSILQHATRLYNESEDAYNGYLSKAYKGGLALTFLVGVVFAISSPFVIQILGGENIEYSSDVLRLLAFIPFLGMLNVSNMIKILVTERKDVLARATWITAFVMLILSGLGSYKFGGYGLAVALLVSEAFSYIVHYYLLKKYSVAKDESK